MPHLYENYRKTIEKEGIGAIPLLPNFESELKANLAKILERHTPAEHLKTATSVRGTSTVVGEAFSETSIPTFKLDGNAFPTMSQHVTGVVRLSAKQQERLVGVTLPTLVRLRAPNHAEVIVKLLPQPNHDGNDWVYGIQWNEVL